MDDTQTRLDLVSVYQQSVLEYESLDRQIRDLLTDRAGRGTEELAEHTHHEYRQLKDRLDVAYNNMKNLEQRVLGDE